MKSHCYVSLSFDENIRSFDPFAEVRQARQRDEEKRTMTSSCSADVMCHGSSLPPHLLSPSLQNTICPPLPPHTYTQTHTQMPTHTHTHAHTCTHIYTQTHTHMPTQVVRRDLKSIKTYDDVGVERRAGVYPAGVREAGPSHITALHTHTTASLHSGSVLRGLVLRLTNNREERHPRVLLPSPPCHGSKTSCTQEEKKRKRKRKKKEKEKREREKRPQSVR